MAEVKPVLDKDGQVVGYAADKLYDGEVGKAMTDGAMKIIRVDPYDAAEGFEGRAMQAVEVAPSRLAEMREGCHPRHRSHVPAPFRYPSDRVELLEFGRAFYEECVQIADRKNQGYAQVRDPFSNFRLAGEIGFAVRMSDKVSRLLNLLRNPDVDSYDESIEDTCKDLANYAMLLAGYRRNERG